MRPTVRIPGIRFISRVCLRAESHVLPPASVSCATFLDGLLLREPPVRHVSPPADASPLLPPELGFVGPQSAIDLDDAMDIQWSAWQEYADSDK